MADLNSVEEFVWGTEERYESLQSRQSVSGRKFARRASHIQMGMVTLNCGISVYLLLVMGGTR
jgi:hypothetical protein